MALEKIRAAARDPRPLLEAVAFYLVGKTQAAFREQGRGGIMWPERSVPNRAGVLADLASGQDPPTRRWDPRPAEIDTGRLRASIAGRVEGDRVIVGSSLSYATDVQRGATKTVALTGALRSALAGWLRRLRGDQKKQARAAFGPLFTLGALTITTPPRPFLVITDDDRRQIGQMARAFFGRASGRTTS